jgi:predicted transglutaminase-like cysteine proteinase
MFKRHLLSVAMALSMVAATIIPAQAYLRAGIPDRGFLPQTSYMAERGRVSAPFGHIEFCIHSPSECLIRSARAKTARLNSNSWRLLKQVNYRVNRSIRAKSDRAAHGKTDHWSIGGRVGDCEDYALTKRHELIRRGWSSNTLLVATARDRRNRMHAVLIAHTNRGDFVLDNLTGSIRAWNKTGYRWLKRQSRQNPKKWVRLNGRPIITGSILAKSSKKLSKTSKARKTVSVASLSKMRGSKKALLPNRSTSKRSTVKLTALPPLPTRNATRHHDTRIARLLTRLADVQKRLVIRTKAEVRITRLLARLENVQKRLIVKKIIKSQQATKKVVRKHKVARKTIRTRRVAKKIAGYRKVARKSSRKRTSSKALALLKKIRRARRHKSVRSHKRRWTQKSYSGISSNS